MIGMNDVRAQLATLNYQPSFWAKKEINELPRIMVPGEKITQISMGWYNGGPALLCCTTERVLLVDKKLLFLTIEDLRYDIIAEVMYQYGLIDATLTLSYAAKSLRFKSWNNGKLRDIAYYIEQRVMELRQSGKNNYSAYIEQPIPIASSQKVKSGLSDKGLANSLNVQAEPNPVAKPSSTSIQQFRWPKASRFITRSQLAR